MFPLPGQVDYRIFGLDIEKLFLILLVLVVIAALLCCLWNCVLYNLGMNHCFSLEGRLSDPDNRQETHPGDAVAVTTP